MYKIKNNLIKKSRLSFLLLAIFGMLFFNLASHINVRAESCDDLTGDDKDRCEKLEKEAKEYQEIIDIKIKQQNSLQKQMALLDAEQSKNQANLQDVTQKFKTVTQQINDLLRRIEYAEAQIKQQRIVLAGLMQSYYEDYQQGILDIVLANKDFSDILNQSDYVQQSSVRVSEVLKTIQDTKDDLDKQKNDLEEKKIEHEQLKNELEDKKSELQSTEYQKQTLLSQTQGEEQKYQQLLARVEQQKTELFNLGGFTNYSIGSDDRPKEKDYLSNSWYYSQGDSSWGNMKIGVTSDKMKDYGCAITSVAMVYTYYGNRNTPKDILKKSDFDGSYIYWPKGWHDTGYGYTNYKSKLDGILKNDDVAILHLAGRSGGGHFVVAGGKDKHDYIIHDPYFGSSIYLGASLSILNAYVDRIIYK